MQPGSLIFNITFNYSIHPEILKEKLPKYKLHRKVISLNLNCTEHHTLEISFIIADMVRSCLGKHVLHVRYTNISCQLAHGHVDHYK